MEIDQKISEDSAYLFCEQTRMLKDKTEIACLELGKRLLYIKDNNLAESQYGGFDLYLDDIKIKRSTADHMMRVYKRFCIEFTIPMETVAEAGGYTRVYELLPIAKTRETALQALESAKHLPSRESIKKMVKEELNDPQVNTCIHEETFVIKVCKCCNEKWRVYEENEAGA